NQRRGHRGPSGSSRSRRSPPSAKRTAPTTSTICKSASPRRRSRGPRLGLRCVGQALATEAIAECARSGSVGEAESNIELLDFVATPAAPDWDALFTVERIDL